MRTYLAACGINIFCACMLLAVLGCNSGGGHGAGRPATTPGAEPKPTLPANCSVKINKSNLRAAAISGFRVAQVCHLSDTEFLQLAPE